MQVIASYSIKGGVGKTAAIVNLAHVAAQAGARVLLWDIDPQGAASFYFRIKPRVKGGSRQLLRKRDVDPAIKGSDFERLDILPADFSYRYFDLQLEEAGKPRRRIGQILDPLADQYDIVLLDCPPSISLLSESIFRAADALLVPVIPTPLSARTLEQLVSFSGSPKFGKAEILPFFSLADRRKKLHREAMRELPAQWPGLFLNTVIANSSIVEQMGIRRAPVPAYAPASPPAKAYAALLEEIILRLAAKAKTSG